MTEHYSTHFEVNYSSILRRPLQAYDYEQHQFVEVTDGDPSKKGHKQEPDPNWVYKKVDPML